MSLIIAALIGAPPATGDYPAIQLASQSRQAQESIVLLEAELLRQTDPLDDAVRGFLALALTDLGREREAVEPD